jgi:hypothetical protein
MVFTIMVVISLHVLAAIFWAGSTMGAAITKTISRRLFIAQVAAALIVVAAGTYLWTALHDAEQGAAEHGLAVGAGCAILALLVQAIVVGPLVMRGDRLLMALTLTSRGLLAYRVAIGLLSVAAISMAVDRYL